MTNGRRMALGVAIYVALLLALVSLPYWIIT